MTALLCLSGDLLHLCWSRSSCSVPTYPLYIPLLLSKSYDSACYATVTAHGTDRGIDYNLIDPASILIKVSSRCPLVRGRLAGRGQEGDFHSPVLADYTHATTCTATFDLFAAPGDIPSLHQSSLLAAEHHCLTHTVKIAEPDAVPWW